MHQHIHWPLNKQELYPLLTRQAASLTEGCPPVSALANTAALLWEALPDINWAGFYLLRDDQLHLGPFQGKTACVVIPVGRGVCGTAARTLQIQVVPDVEEFPGHIACDSASRSEIVIPMVCQGKLLGVLDIDAPVPSRFDQADAAGLFSLVSVLTEQVDWSQGLL
ncbi:MAG: GAF domain-containing protein [Clostridia bacterium]|nr:GAF domain-containing protein [Clostridia bacterium]